VKRLTDLDTSNHVFLLTLAVRIGPPVMLVLCIVEFYFWGLRFLWFILPDIAATGLVVLGANKLIGGMGLAASAVLFPSGKGTPPPREYSEQEALVVRGHFAEAADSYRAIIEDEPTLLDPRFRLARLLENECGEVEAAERCYLDIRALNPLSDQDWIVSNGLIDLYHRTGQRDRLKAELGRMSRRYTGTDAGTGAKRRLQELADEDAANDAAGATELPQ
jgi:hypothetical protein